MNHQGRNPSCGEVYVARMPKRSELCYTGVYCHKHYLVVRQSVEGRTASHRKAGPFESGVRTTVHN